ncbi:MULTISPECIES: MBL fold metallo-hydrolase [unclassified Clostridium]|nr:MULTISPECIES: MBL fold metallo-hydrolase [unclassified Clostridium]
MAKLLYQGQASLRIVTSEGKVIYIDPYAGEYDMPADLILVTHQHFDHNKVELVKRRNSGCVIISQDEALKNGKHQIFKLGYVTVEAVEAGYNRYHDITKCVGYILTFTDGKTIYISGDTSKTKQMNTLAERNLDYAIFCCDGHFNMDMDEAAECAAIVGAKYNIPYHMSIGEVFNPKCAEQFQAKGRIIVADGEEIMIK